MATIERESAPQDDRQHAAPKQQNGQVPKRHHLDKMADRLAALGAGPPDDVLTTRAAADWLGRSTQFLEIGRSKGYGPKFIRLSPRAIRYRREDVLEWLRERTHASTAEYRRSRVG